MKQATILLLFAWIACTCGCPTGDDTGDDPALARIEVHPATLEFNLTTVGHSSTLEATISNVGDGKLTLEDLTLDGPVSLSLDDDATDRLLAPGDSTTVAVTYTPTGYENASGQLHVISDDAETPDWTTELLASSLAPKIELDPAEHDFGDLPVGCEQEIEVAIRNVGNAPLLLYEIVFGPTSEELVFSFYFSEGAVLDGGQDEAITVYYEPQDELADTGYIHVYSNDPERPDVLATQFGTAHYGSAVVDEFVQEGNDSTDILWVVDNSSSMNALQNGLATDLIVFLDILNALGIDYHVAVVTTDSPVIQGDFLGSDPFANFTVVDEAYTTEQGLEMGIQALTPPMTDPGQANDGFLRETAGLRVIFFSDEEDQSSDTVTDYITRYQALKANPDHVILSAIVDPAIGIRYDQAASMTGGLSVDNNTNPNWINTLSQLAWLSMSWQDTFELSQIPVDGTITVEIDGVATGIGWYFDGVINAVVFEPDYIPQTGETVTIRYNEMTSCP